MWSLLSLKPKLIAAGMIVLLLGMVYGTHKVIVYRAVSKAKAETSASMNAEFTKRLLEASELAREREHVMMESADKIRKEKDAKIVLLNNRVGSLLSELRQRPQRPPSTPEGSPATGSPKGATGAELYREDSLFLVGEARRADRLRLSLEQCYREYDSVRESLSK